MKKRIWLALSGWWARWFAHIWVYQALIEEGYEIVAISGCSMWSLVAMMISLGKSPLQIVELYNKINIPFLPKNIWTSGIVLDKYSKKLREELWDINFDNLKIPLYVSCTNLNIGQNVIFSEGNLKDIINASMALPMVADPVIINWQTYIDGGITDNLPAQILRQNHEELDLVIWVDVNYYRTTNKLEFDKKTVLMRSIAIMFGKNDLVSKKFCDIYICPEQLAYFDIFNFDKINEIVDIWYQEAKKILSKII